MRLSQKDIDKQIEALDVLVPRMLERTGSAEVWVEFLDRANEIKARLPPGQKYLVWEKVCEMLASSNLSQLRDKALSSRATTCKVYAFPTGLRIS